MVTAGLHSDKLINSVKYIQDVLLAVKVPTQEYIPQICVIGSQSSGKSGVLQTIIGNDILPRGDDVVTRRPLYLQLVNTPDDAHLDEYVEFSNRPGKQYRDCAEIREEIRDETKSKAGSNYGISSLPIALTIYSPTVPTLTLVDLPGLAKEPRGDQPIDIENATKVIARKYISQPTCIILLVVGADEDLTSSEALKLAKAVDPSGHRTLGVITKVDKASESAVVEILACRVVPLYWRFVPMYTPVPRDKSMSFTAALEAERRYFESHESFKDKLQHCGTSCLVQRLEMIIIHRLRMILPKLKQEMSKQIDQFFAEQ